MFDGTPLPIITGFSLLPLSHTYPTHHRADRETGRPRGFGFVTMESGAAMAAAAELNNTDFMGRTIRVNEAAPPGEGGRGRGGGGYGGGGYGGGRGRGELG